MIRKVIGIGAGGHAKGIIEILRDQESYEIVGLLTPKLESHPEQILGVPILGNDEILPKLRQEGIQYFFVGVGGIGDNQPRKRLFEFALFHKIKPVNVIHPQAIISPSAEIGDGATLMAGTIVNSCARLGSNVIVNTGAIVEHDCVIGNHVHIATGARLAGTVQVGDGAHIGAGAVVRQCISIGERAIVGAGAVVVRDVAPYSVVVGVPARKFKRK